MPPGGGARRAKNGGASLSNDLRGPAPEKLHLFLMIPYRKELLQLGNFKALRHCEEHSVQYPATKKSIPMDFLRIWIRRSKAGIDCFIVETNRQSSSQ